MGACEFEAALAGGLGQFPKGAVLLAAVSGGADSTAMLAGLASLQKTGVFTLRCIHVNHGIRPAHEHEGDAAFVKGLCQKLNVPCVIAAVKPGSIAALAKVRGIGIEAAARNYRRAAWKREAEKTGAAAVLVAHTRDDALENILMAFIRGAGPAGLSLMPPGRFRVHRPILGLSRPQVLAYLRERGLDYRTDSSNADTAYFRNSIRRKLTPLLDREFPAWRRGLAGLGETQRLVSSYLRREAKKAVPWKLLPGRLEFPADGFFAQSEIIREEAVYLGLRLLRKTRSLGPDPGRGLLKGRPKRRVLRLFASGLVRAADLGGIRLKREDGKIVMCFQAEKKRGFSLLVSSPGSYALPWPGLHLTISLEPESGKAGVISNNGEVFPAALPLVLRGELAGDRFFLNGKNRPLSEVLPKKEREGDLILAEDREGIAACIGLAGGRIKVLLYRKKELRASQGISIINCLVRSGGVNAEQE